MSHTVTLQSDCLDVELVSTNPTANHNNAWVRMGEHKDVTDQYFRMLIAFSTLASGGVPKNRAVLSSRLGLYLYDDKCSYSRTYSFFRLKTDWVENQASWNSRKTGTAWEVAGVYDAGATNADYEIADPIATKTLAASEADGWKWWDMDTTKMFEMINGPWVNNGLFGMCNAEFNDMYYFYSKQFTTDPTLTPKLEVVLEDYVGGVIVM